MMTATGQMVLFAEMTLPEKWCVAVTALVGASFLIYLGANLYACVTELRAGLLSVYAWLLRIKVRRALARQKVTDDRVLEALHDMGEIVFFNGNQVCVCVRGEGGRFPFTPPASGGTGEANAVGNVA